MNKPCSFNETLVCQFMLERHSRFFCFLFFMPVNLMPFP